MSPDNFTNHAGVDKMIEPAGFAVALPGGIDETEIGRFSCFKEALLKSDGKMFSESVADEPPGGNHIAVLYNRNRFCS
jgi:hypothetical protein